MRPADTELCEKPKLDDIWEKGSELIEALFFRRTGQEMRYGEVLKMRKAIVEAMEKSL